MRRPFLALTFLALILGASSAGAAGKARKGLRTVKHTSAPKPSGDLPAVAAEPPRARAETAEARPELPRGGRTLFPAHRLVGFCGTPGAPKLGKLAGNLTLRAQTIQSYANKYAGGRKALPVFELIAVVVQQERGKDGKSRRRVPERVVDDYLAAARAAKGLLLLNIQPGHSDFLTETKHFEKYLRHPDVGVALDPEWAMRPHQTPGRTFGRTTGAAINEVAAYLSKLVADHDLPEKALVFHQVNDRVLKDEGEIGAFPGVAIIKSVDGLGPKATKIRTYASLVKDMPSAVRPGFKLFFDEDTAQPGSALMTPEQVLALGPEPDYVMYE